MLPALLHKIHTDSAPELVKYKVAGAYWEALGPWLEEKTREQVEAGLIGEGDAERVGAFREFDNRGERVVGGMDE